MPVIRYGVWATPKTTGVEPCWHTERLPTVTYSIADAEELGRKAVENNDRWTYEVRPLPEHLQGTTAQFARDLTYDGWVSITIELRGTVAGLQARVKELEADNWVLNDELQKVAENLADAQEAGVSMSAELEDLRRFKAEAQRLAAKCNDPCDYQELEHYVRAGIAPDP